MGKPEFGKGMEVEVCSDDQGLRGAWFVATILRSFPRKKQVFVEYHTLMAEDESTKPLRETVDIVNIRPVVPREIDRGFSISDEVDAAHNDGWWEGVVIRVLEEDSYLVYFRTGKEEHVFQRSELRIHREWVHGKWVPPLATEQLQKTEKQDVNAEHNQTDARGGHFIHYLASDQQQCRRGGKNWHCLLVASSGKVYCEKHQAEQDNNNERKRKSYTTKQSRFAMDPLRPSGQHQCRRTGKGGWRCPETEKHQLEQNIHNAKKRKGKIEQKVLVNSGYGEIKSLNGYHSAGLKRTRGEDGENAISYNLVLDSGVVNTENPKRCTQSLDDSLKTAEREFNDEKHTFDEMKESIARTSIQLQALLEDIKMRAEKIVEL